MSKKKKKEDKPDSDNDNGEELEEESDSEIDEEVEELARVLDKEEKKMDDALEEVDDEENEKLVRDIKIIEEVMEEEVMLEMAKPVHQVLYKVGDTFFYLWLGDTYLGLVPLVVLTTPWCLFFLFFVLPFFFASVLLLPFLLSDVPLTIPFPALETGVCNQKFNDYYITSME